RRFRRTPPRIFALPRGGRSPRWAGTCRDAAGGEMNASATVACLPPFEREAVAQAMPTPALVHDFLLTPRGGERTFQAMAECWPGAPIYTSLFDTEAMTDRFTGHSVVTSVLQATGAGQRNFRTLLPFFPAAIERLPLGGRELVVSSSSSFAHGVRIDDDATHVCYCHSPFRYVWHERSRALAEAPAPLRPAVRATLRALRRWDRAASQRVTHYVANSQITRSRIADFYERDAVVIHPPVDVSRFGVLRDPEDYLLFVGEVTSHKRVEVALAAAALACTPITVVGDGPDRERLSQLYPNATFAGRVDDAGIERLMSRALALIVPNVEEFGIAAVEAQAAGRPVLAIDRGGTAETVVDGRTGVLVAEGSVDEFADAIASTDFTRFDSFEIALHARSFSADRFKDELTAHVAACAA
ncbi:MAG: glycosyltransferase, partial [Actinomycetota bacterium]|nr:glycosyltransferase [Actinomycetota bacterium]